MVDLYNNLKVYKPEVKGMSSSSLSTQNMAFVSSSNNNASSTNEAINTAYGVSIAITQVNATYSTNIDNLSVAVICSFFASQPNSPQLVHEDLEKFHPHDIEEMDLRWKIAMLTMRARRFLKKIGRKLIVNGNETIDFDKSNVDCYNCHKRRNFASEELQEIKTTRTRKAQEGAYLWKHLIPQLWCHVMVLVDMTGVIRQRKDQIMYSWLSHL
nr:ribonuclease H-like domain-containing protein [Tanacetum cinerariifolium]